MAAVLIPQPGRDHYSANSAIAAWESGEPFLCRSTGRQVTRSDHPELGTIRIRYRNQSRITHPLRAPTSGA